MQELVNYYDYRQFIKDFCLQQKKINSSYSYRLFSKRAGVSSSAHLPLVLAGKRNLTGNMLEKYCVPLKLKGEHKKYFYALVEFNQAKEVKDKERKLQKLEKIRTKFKKQNLPIKQTHSLYSKWFYVPIYELIQTANFVNDGKWIAKKLGKRISSIQAALAIRALLDAGHIQKDEMGKITTKNPIVYSVDETENILVRAFQLKMIEESIMHINDPIEEREFNSLTIGLCEQQKIQLKEKIKNFVEEVNSEFSVNDGEQKIFQLNLQLFSFE